MFRKGLQRMFEWLLFVFFHISLVSMLRLAPKIYMRPILVALPSRELPKQDNPCPTLSLTKGRRKDKGIRMYHVIPLCYWRDTAVIYL